ncbi:MAG: YHS domain-containing protein [Chloroflexi bacterium]|nr:YHS domain-containing protein [Chloroflexota bacterium]
MEVTEAGAAGKYEYKSKMYYFCAPGCMNSFKKEPEKYLDPNYKPSM